MDINLTIIFILLICFGICFFFFRRYYLGLLKKETKRAQKSGQLKSVFIENVSHSLRTPLSAISGYCNMILDEKDEEIEPTQVREMVTRISDDSQQLLDFVSQLYNMSKFEGITPSFTFIEVNLTELMASYRRETMNITKPDVTVRVSTDLSPHCRGILDTNFMHQLMMHLLTNAANHITQGDIVIKYGMERRGDMGLRVSITYMGIGQAEVIGADIYTYLQKEDVLKDASKSVILGLATCKAIVEVLGGEFFMDTEYNKKTVASFWIPCKLKDAHKDI